MVCFVNYEVALLIILIALVAETMFQKNGIGVANGVFTADG